MARRNLLAEAQVQAQAQVAPQLAALGEALRQARTDRNAAIHTAAAASRGIGRAINRSQGTLKRAYKDTANLGAPGQSYSSGAYAGAAANERAVTGTVLASSLANALKEGSDRRIEAAAGRAYRTAAAEGVYQSNVATVQSKRQALAAQEGLLTGAAFSKLTEAAAGRKQQRILQGQRLRSQSDLQSQRLTSQASLQSDRLASQETVAGARIRSSEHNAALGRRQQKLNRQNQRVLQNQRLSAKSSPAAKPPTDRAYKGRNDISTLVQQYKPSGVYSDDVAKKVAKKAREAGFNESIIRAASNLASKGYVAGREVSELAALGIDIPKEWTGVTVRPHTRRRRGK